MALVNHIKREINAKIVYYGPERSGKATSLRYVYDRIKPELRGDLKSVPASGSSLLFFDFSPFEQPVFGGYRIRLHIYTLQGRVDNPAAWKMTLKGADGLVIVTDATQDARSVALQSVAQLRDFIGSYGLGLDDLPIVLQLNKIDLAGLVFAESTASELGLSGCSACLTNAVSGEGILKALTSLSRSIMLRIGERDDLSRVDGPAAEPVVEGAPSEEHADPVAEQEIYHASLEGLLPDMSIDSPVKKDTLPLVVISDTGIHVEYGVVRIPLEISSATGIQRLVVSVTIATE